MIALLGIILAFYWLARETDWLRIRLLVGPEAPKILTLAPDDSQFLAKDICHEPIKTAPKLLAAPAPMLLIEAPHYHASDFTPLDMPDFTGTFQILCVRE